MVAGPRRSCAYLEKVCPSDARLLEGSKYQTTVAIRGQQQVVRAPYHRLFNLCPTSLIRSHLEEISRTTAQKYIPTDGQSSITSLLLHPTDLE